MVLQFRRRALTSGFLALGLLGVMTSGQAEAQPAVYGTCGAVQVIEVRGTGEAGSSGGVLPPLSSQITSRTSRTVLTYGLPYPATSNWSSSVAAGTSALANRLAISALYCPAQRFVLVGYSQGAWVIGDALAGPAPTVSPALGAKVAAVVLYGDPRFRAGEPFNAGTFRAGVSGVIPRAAGALSAYASRIRSYCYADDTICQNGASGNGHGLYVQRSTQAASIFAAGRL